MKIFYLIIATLSFITILFFSVVTVAPPKEVHKIYWMTSNSDKWDIHLKEKEDSLYTDTELKESLKTTYNQTLRGIEYKTIGIHSFWLLVLLVLSIIGYIREKKLNIKQNT